MAASSPRQSLFIQAGSSQELVEELRGLSQLPGSVSLAEFMSRFAYRFAQLNGGKIIRTDSTDHFIADLVNCGWVTVSGSQATG